MKLTANKMIKLQELLHQYVPLNEQGNGAQIVCFGDGLTARRVLKGQR